MNFKLACAVGVVVLAAAWANNTHAQIGTGSPRDARVERNLKELKYRYEITNGDFKVLTNMGRGRTHLVFINSTTNSFGNLEVREVWAFAMKVRGVLPAPLANQLLNDKKKFGGWRATVTDKGETIVYFSAHVSADCDAQTLDTVMDLVLAAADKLEEEVTGKDDY